MVSAIMIILPEIMWLGEITDDINIIFTLLGKDHLMLKSEKISSHNSQSTYSQLKCEDHFIL